MHDLVKFTIFVPAAEFILCFLALEKGGWWECPSVTGSDIKRDRNLLVPCKEGTGLKGWLNLLLSLRN